jgi:hypothetical protein
MTHYTKQIETDTITGITNKKNLSLIYNADPHRNLLASLLLMAIKDSFARSYQSNYNKVITGERRQIGKDVNARRWLTGSDEARTYFELLDFDYEAVRDKLKDKWFVYDKKNPRLKDSRLMIGS